MKLFSLLCVLAFRNPSTNLPRKTMLSASTGKIIGQIATCAV
jgi:hypothetical protein